MSRSVEQELIDIMFQVGMTTKENETILAMDRDEYCAWIRRQLILCGFDVIEVGASYGYLRSEL